MFYILGTNYIRVTTLIPDILYIADNICLTLIRRLSHVTRRSLLRISCILNSFSRGDSDVKLNTPLYQTGLSAADPVSLMVTCASFASSLPVEIIYLQSTVSQHLFFMSPRLVSYFLVIIFLFRILTGLSVSFFSHTPLIFPAFFSLSAFLIPARLPCTASYTADSIIHKFIDLRTDKHHIHTHIQPQSHKYHTCQTSIHICIDTYKINIT